MLCGWHLLPLASFDAIAARATDLTHENNSGKFEQIEKLYQPQKGDDNNLSLRQELWILGGNSIGTGLQKNLKIFFGHRNIPLYVQSFF